jgi:SPP1 gp7 family putative phage head morphogenesis protein
MKELDPIKPAEAIKYWRSKVALTDDEFNALVDKSNDTAFRIAGISDLDVIEKVWVALDDALDYGEDFQAFKNRVTDSLIKNWGESVANPGARIENIYRTNIQSAYQAGHRKEAMRNRDDRPYGLFTIINDSHTSDICSDIDDELDGKAISLDDPIWKKIWPPNHYMCRSTVITLTHDEAVAEGIIEPDEDDVEVAEGFDKTPDEEVDIDPEEYPDELMADVRRFLENE